MTFKAILLGYILGACIVGLVGLAAAHENRRLHAAEGIQLDRHPAIKTVGLALIWPVSMAAIVYVIIRFRKK